MPADIINRKDNQRLFAQYWQEFVAHNKLGPEYLLTNIDYLLAYSDKLVTDRSFILAKNNQPVAVVFLPIEKDEQYKSMTIAQSFVPAPVFLAQKDLEANIMHSIDQIASTENVAKIMLRIDPLEHQQYPYNFLINYDYLDASLLGYLLDCQQPEMRRNHRRAVKKIQDDPDFSIFIMDQKNSDYQIHETYRAFHHKCAGKITRPKATFDWQFKMLEQGNAVLVGLKYKDQFIAFTYFTYQADKAVSFSAADDPAFDHLPLYHIINAQALAYLKNHGVKEMDMGQPLTISDQFFYHPDAKQKNISLFKTGFGGRFVQNFYGVKYFSQQLFEA
ncbi:hypothetical protein COW86_00220, partial [Candidatus Kuenenbacteria bacterium CG22_combo_CG10-13_8_21_14_all_39_9]